MKVSLNTIKHFNTLYNSAEDPYAFGVDDIIRRIGHQLGAVEDVVYSGEKYEGIVVAKVVSVLPHPDADKLHICMIDDGQAVENVERGNGGLVQVVCGAPNVEAGQLVAWLPPGATVPSTLSVDPFTLESREIRGKMSNGMLGSPKELDIAEDHQGILVINPDDVGEELASPGTAFKKLYGLDDVIIDCENKMFTHRPDCFGMLGIAREIAGIFDQPYTSPKWYKAPIEQDDENELVLEASVENPELVPRLMLRALTNVSVGPSPLWMQAFLKRIGIKSINNIVDYTNYFMMVTGQPLHAFDYDKVVALTSADGAYIQARTAKEGEEITLLGGKTVTLSDKDMVIATDTVPIALAGVMGGASTEVDDSTRNIVIECANFDMYAIRRTSMRHGLFTDAVTRFNKGQSPLQNDRVLAKIIDEIQKTSDTRIASPLIDIASFNVAGDNLNRVTTTVKFINERLGSNLKGEDIKRLLENVEFVVASDINESELLITAPFWRMDITIPEDIVEEVGRLNGYDQLPVNLPARSSAPAPKNAMRTHKQKLRESLKALGANEVLSYSFVHGDLLRASGVDPDQSSYHLRNAISPDLQYYRTSIVPSLLSKINANLKVQSGSADNQFALFEIGKAHIKNFLEPDSDLPAELEHLGFVFVADSKTSQQFSGSPYYQTKKYCDQLVAFKAVYAPIEDMNDPAASVYAPGRCAKVMVGDHAIGVIGEIGPNAKKALKLPDYCAGFELDLVTLAKVLKPTKYSPLSTFPSSIQDITLEVELGMEWATVYNLIHAEIAVAAAEDDVSYTLEPLDIFQAEASNKKRLSFRLVMTHHKTTLTTQRVNAILEHIESIAVSSLNAVRV